MEQKDNLTLVGRYLDGDQSERLYKSSDGKFSLHFDDGKRIKLTEKEALSWVINMDMQNSSEEKLREYFSDKLISELKPNPMDKNNLNYETGYSGQTLTEDFQSIRNFIITRGNSEKNIHDSLFKEYQDKVSNPEFKEIFEKYFKESKSPGILSSQQKVLEKYLKDLHLVNQTILVKDKNFAERLVNEKGYQIHINLEADQLLKGSANYSTEVAAKEAGKLRQSLLNQYNEITQLRKDKLDLGQKLDKVNQALTNLVGNLKAVFGFDEQKINDLMKTPPPKEVAKEVVKTNKVDKGMSI